MTRPKSKSEGVWRNRIVDHDVVLAGDLTANPANARMHPRAQRAALGALLDGVGFIAPVIVNRTTGLIVDGHLRVEQASERNESVPVVPQRRRVRRSIVRCPPPRVARLGQPPTRRAGRHG